MCHGNTCVRLLACRTDTCMDMLKVADLNIYQKKYEVNPYLYDLWALKFHASASYTMPRN